MKKYLIGLIVALLILPNFVFAADTLTNLNLSDVKADWQEKLGDLEDRRIERLKTQGEQMIERRVLDLSRAKSTLASMVRVSDAVKNDLTAKIDSNINALNALKDDIAAETELEKLRELVRSIVLDYRVYIVFLPQSRGYAVVDRAMFLSDKILELNEGVEAKIDELAAAGLDVSKVQETISEVENDIAFADVLIDEAEDDFGAMQVSDIDAARSLKLSGKQNLVDARIKGKNALASLKEAIVMIRELASRVIPTETAE